MNRPSICYRCARQEKCSMHKKDAPSTVVSDCGGYKPDEATQAFVDEFEELRHELEEGR